jgi:hypothetical protein
LHASASVAVEACHVKEMLDLRKPAKRSVDCNLPKRKAMGTLGSFYPRLRHGGAIVNFKIMEAMAHHRPPLAWFFPTPFFPEN